MISTLVWSGAIPSNEARICSEGHVPGEVSEVCELEECKYGDFVGKEVRSQTLRFYRLSDNRVKYMVLEVVNCTL